MNEMTHVELVKQVRQNEEIIAQLLEIVAVTNRRLTELDRKQTDHYLLT